MGNTFPNERSHLRCCRWRWGEGGAMWAECEPCQLCSAMCTSHFCMHGVMWTGTPHLSADKHGNKGATGTSKSPNREFCSRLCFPLEHYFGSIDFVKLPQHWPFSLCHWQPLSACRCCYLHRLVWDYHGVEASSVPHKWCVQSLVLITWNTTVGNKPRPDLLLIKMQSDLLPVGWGDWTWRETEVERLPVKHLFHHH